MQCKPHAPSPLGTRLSTMYSYKSIWNVGKSAVAHYAREEDAGERTEYRESGKTGVKKRILKAGLYLSAVCVAFRGSMREERGQGGEERGLWTLLC